MAAPRAAAKSGPTLRDFGETVNPGGCSRRITAPNRERPHRGACATDQLEGERRHVPLAPYQAVKVREDLQLRNVRTEQAVMNGIGSISCLVELHEVSYHETGA